MTNKTIRANPLRASLAGFSLLALATAAQAQARSAGNEVDQLVITAARTILPASALPLTPCPYANAPRPACCPQWAFSSSWPRLRAWSDSWPSP